MQTSEEISKEKIVDILTSVGYVLRPDGDGWRTRAIYRDGSKSNSVKINGDGTFKDFANGYFGNIKFLVKLTVGDDECEKIFQDQLIEKKSIVHKEAIQFMAKLDKEKELAKILPQHDYWLNRGISLDIIKKFKGGVCKIGRFKDRYTFPIFNGKGDLIGLSGRLLYKHDEIPKWKHYNGSSEWRYPLFLNYRVLRKRKSVIIVESIGDCLSLFERGINNVVVSFGLKTSFNLINLFMEYDMDKIYIAFNNDKNDRGNIAAEKELKRIGKFFSGNSVKIVLPQQKDEDFNSLLIKDPKLIDEWYKRNIKQ